MNKLLLFILLISFRSNAQEEIDPTISLDLLKSPTSVAFNLLGIAQSDIDRPTDLTSFAISIRNSTNNFTRIPSNYASEISPGWLSRKPNLTLDKFNSKSFSDVFWQTLSVSFGVSKQDIEGKESDAPDAFTRTGIGAKLSLFRPKWTGETEKLYQNIKKLQVQLLHDATLDRRKIQNDDFVLDSLKKERLAIATDLTINRPDKMKIMLDLDQVITNRKQIINDSLDNSIKQKNEFYRALTKSASEFKVERVGFFLDFSGGLVLDFPEDKFNNSRISKAGAWLTGGYEGGNSNISMLGIVRYLFQPDKIFADETGLLKSDNISTFDGGVRCILKGANGKFNTSAEAIYRGTLNKNSITPSWRLVINAEYDVGMNKKITFAFGRNFNKTISNSGNLITALNFIAGFGSKRKTM